MNRPTITNQPLVPSMRTMRQICDYFAGQTNYPIDVEVIRKPKRNHHLSVCRMFIGYYLYIHCKWTYEQIAWFFGQDHTTVIYHQKQLIEQMRTRWDNETKDHFFVLKPFFKRPQNGTDIWQFFDKYQVQPRRKQYVNYKRERGTKADLKKIAREFEKSTATAD